jgi:hypothetical protein
MYWCNVHPTAPWISILSNTIYSHLSDRRAQTQKKKYNHKHKGRYLMLACCSLRSIYSLDPSSSLVLRVRIIASRTLMSLSFFAISSCFSRNSSMCNSNTPARCNRDQGERSVIENARHASVETGQYILAVFSSSFVTSCARNSAARWAASACRFSVRARAAAEMAASSSRSRD